MSEAQNLPQQEPEQHTKLRLPIFSLLVATLLIGLAFTIGREIAFFRGANRQAVSGNVTVGLGPVVSGTALDLPLSPLSRFVLKSATLRQMLALPTYSPSLVTVVNEAVAVNLFVRSTSGVPSFDYTVQLSDDQGWRNYMIPVGSNAGEIIWGVNHRMYFCGMVPRSSRKLKVQLVAESRAGPKDVARWDVENPIYGKRPAGGSAGGAPPKLDSQDRDLSATLVRLISGVGGVQTPWSLGKDTAEKRGKRERFERGDFPAPKPLELPGTVALLGFSEGGKPVNRWGVVEATVRDPYGAEHTIWGNEDSNHVLGDLYCCTFYPMLWRGEGKFTIKLKAAKAMDLAEDELLTATAVVPPLGARTDLLLTRQVGGTTLTVESVTGANYKYKFGGSEYDRYFPEAHLVLQEPDQFHVRMHTFEAETTAPRPRTIQTEGLGPSTSSGGKRLAYLMGSSTSTTLESLPAGTTITLTFSVTPIRNLEFVGEPEPLVQSEPHN